MHEWREEAIGSMPSVPQPKPLPQKPSSNNMGVGIGLLLWVLCLLVFPQYARIGDMSTGIFYGMSLVLLLMALAIIGSNGSSGRTNQKLLSVESRPMKSRKRYITRFLIISVLLGIYVVTLSTTVDLFYNVGFIVLLIVIFMIYRIISRFVRKNKQLGVTQTKPHFVEPQPKRVSSSLDRSLGLLLFLFAALFLLIFPKIMGENDLIAGIFYGAGLIVLLLTIIGVSSEISKLLKKKAIPV